MQILLSVLKNSVMNSAIPLRLLILLCSLSIATAEDDDTNTDEGEFHIAKAIVEVKAKLGHIITINVEQYIKTHGSLTRARAATRDAFVAELTNQLNDIRIAVNAGVAEGKNVKHCFLDAGEKLQAIQENVEYQLGACADASYKSYTDTFDISNKIQDEGNAIIAKLNITNFACREKMHNKQLCVTQWIEECKIFIKHFDKKCLMYPQYRKITFGQLSRDNFLCLYKNYEEGRKQIAEIKVISDTCLKETT